MWIGHTFVSMRSSATPMRKLYFASSRLWLINTFNFGVSGYCHKFKKTYIFEEKNATKISLWFYFYLLASAPETARLKRMARREAPPDRVIVSGNEISHQVIARFWTFVTFRLLAIQKSVNFKNRGIKGESEREREPKEEWEPATLKKKLW